MRERDKPCFEAHLNLLKATKFRLQRRSRTKRSGITFIALQSSYVYVDFNKEIDTFGRSIETFGIIYVACEIFPGFPGLVPYFMPHNLAFVIIDGQLLKIIINEKEYYYNDLEVFYRDMRPVLKICDTLFDIIGEHIYI